MMSRFVGASLAALTFTLAACSAEDSKGKGSDANDEESACDSTRAYFARDVWAPVMGQICIDCHLPGGLAAEKGADFLLLPPGYPGFLDENFREVQRVARPQVDGTSQILLKPLGELNHGGSRVLDEDSSEYAALAELVSRLNQVDECESPDVVPTLPDVEMLTPIATLRKASLSLVGRLPHPEEVQRVVDGEETALRDVLFELMQEEAFLQRVKEIYNDVLLTDRYLSYNGHALNILNEDDFPIAGDYYDNLEDDARAVINLSVAREPLELIALVVRGDRPFTEVLTADYTALNGSSAAVYNVQPPTGDYPPDDPFYEGRIQVVRDGAMLPWPHAGILTSPMFLNRFPTTPTNRNRHRARKVFEFFLATDILKIGERPIDPTASTQYINPTRDDAACSQCHRQIDPVAGAFLKFDDNDQERYRPDREWHPEMFAPGYADEVLPVTEFGQSAQWLAQRIAADPRFALSTVYTMFRALTGKEPLEYPAETSAADHAARLGAWEAQEATFRAIQTAFVESNYNLKVAVADIVLSPYYRAIGLADGLSNEDVDKLRDVGTGRLLTPEQLSRKIRAVTGVPWGRGRDGKSYLESDYRILYGGMDSDTVEERLTTPNGVMAAVQWRMANEVACLATSWDFNLPRDERFLFRLVTKDDTPGTNRAAIEENIRFLHAQILGEDVDLGSEELARTYRLFEETWNEGIVKVASEEESKRLTYACQSRRDPFTREDLPEDRILQDDESYVIRSWQAVTTYLLADYGFLYE